MCPQPSCEEQEECQSNLGYGTNHQGNNGKAKSPKAVSHVTLDKVKPLIFSGKGWILILTKIHNWPLVLSTHGVTSVDVQ